MEHVEEPPVYLVGENPCISCIFRWATPSIIDFFHCFPQKTPLDKPPRVAKALSYYEFVAHALGLKAAVVELALYDLSQGVAQWVPPSLLGALPCWS